MGTLSWAYTLGGYSSETQAGGGPRIPRVSWEFAGPGDPLGGGGMRDQEAQDSQGNSSVPRALRFRSGPRPPPPSASPAACVSSRYPRLRPSPRPAPLTRLGCGAPLRAPQCRLQLRLQLRSRSGSGSRSDAAALGLGWGVPPLRLGLRCVQGRGAPERPGRTDPRPRSPGEPLPAVSRALPCPALQQQPRPAARCGPRAAARATVTLSGPLRRRRGFPGLSSAAPRPGSLLRWGRGGGGSGEPRPSAHSQPDTHTAAGGRAGGAGRQGGRGM